MNVVVCLYNAATDHTNFTYDDLDTEPVYKTDASYNSTSRLWP
jgi:hypothetical protein